MTGNDHVRFGPGVAGKGPALRAPRRRPTGIPAAGRRPLLRPGERPGLPGAAAPRGHPPRPAPGFLCGQRGAVCQRLAGPHLRRARHPPGAQPALLPTLNRPIVTRLKSGQIGVDWPVKRRYPGLEAGPISDWPVNGASAAIRSASARRSPSRCRPCRRGAGSPPGCAGRRPVRSLSGGSPRRRRPGTPGSPGRWCTMRSPLRRTRYWTRTRLR